VRGRSCIGYDGILDRSICVLCCGTGPLVSACRGVTSKFLGNDRAGLAAMQIDPWVREKAAYWLSISRRAPQLGGVLVSPDDG